jgi:hypothetical protein
MPNKLQYFAEIVESSLWDCTAQSWQFNQAPAYGSLLVIEDQNTKYFGLVCQISTGSLDTVRLPIAYQKTEQELQQELPQIFEFLKTTFTCLLVGYQAQVDLKANQLIYTAPAVPPKIHMFVRAATAPELELFFNSYQFLHLLFSRANQMNNQIDELLLAVFQRAKTKLDLATKLDEFTELFALLVGRDYQRLRLFFGRLELILK